MDREGKTLILRQPVRPIRCYRANVALGWTEISSSEAALRGHGESTLAVSIRPGAVVELSEELPFNVLDKSCHKQVLERSSLSEWLSAERINIRAKTFKTEVGDVSHVPFEELGSRNNRPSRRG